MTHKMFPLEEFSQHVALIDGDLNVSVTYRELAEKIEHWNGYFGDNRGLIFLFCQNTIEAVALYIAAVERGQPICLLDGNCPSEQKQRLIELYKPTYVVDLPSSTTELKIVQNSSSSLPIHPKLQLLLSTSGTTGSPKLVRLSTENILNNATSIVEYLAITPEERAIASLPFHYSYGLSVLNSHLLAGASLVLTQKSVIQADFWKVFDNYRCTSFAGVPYTYHMLHRIGFERFALPTLKTCTQAGGRLEKSLILKFHEVMSRRGARFITMYGQTEATARISYLPSQMLPEKAGAIGIPIPGGRLYSRNEDDQPCPVGVHGELVYEGPNVMMGYALSPEDFARGDECHGVLRTGDLGYHDEEGVFFITGRKKRISKVYGYRINLDEVEQHLRDYAPVAAVSNDNKITLFFEVGKPETFAACINSLVQQYKLHHTTFECQLIDRLPLTPNGKIDYQLLQEIAYDTT